MKTYRRAMTGWWQRNPFYIWYMLREASCVFIAAYALLLLAGLYRLSQGKAAFEAWLATLTLPGSIVFHLIALALVIYHSWTWFKIMPKTMPLMPVPDRAIVASGIVVAVLCNIILWAAMR